MPKLPDEGLRPQTNRFTHSDLSKRLSLVQARSRRTRETLSRLERDVETLSVDIAARSITDLISRASTRQERSVNELLTTSMEFKRILRGLYREGRGVSPNAVLGEFRSVPRSGTE